MWTPLARAARFLGLRRAPTVSIVMATYNGTPHLAEQLDSLAAQSLPPDEVIIGDDASSDGTADLLVRYAATSPLPIRLSPAPTNLGYTANFARLAQQARSDIVLFCDQDDIWHADKIARMVAAFDAGADFVRHDLRIFFEDRPPIESYFAYLDGIGMPRAVCYKGCSLGVRRQFLDFWGWPPQESRLSHDFWVALLGSAFGAAVRLDAPLISHRIHSANTSGWIAQRTDLPEHWPDQPLSDAEVLGQFVLRRKTDRRVPALRMAVDARADQLDPLRLDRFRALLTDVEARRNGAVPAPAR